MEAPKRLRPSENSQYPFPPFGTPVTPKETGQEEEKHAYRYFPEGRRSTPEDGTSSIWSVSTGGGGGRSFSEEIAFFVLKAGDVFKRLSQDPEDAEPVPEIPSDTEYWGISASESASSELPVAELGNGGTNSMRSDEYPENEVVNPSGNTGSPEDIVRRELSADDLMRNSDDVESSTRIRVFSRVAPEKESLKMGPIISAREKYPDAVPTRKG